MEPVVTRTLPGSSVRIWQNSEWLPFSAVSHQKASILQNIRIMTFNVWFDDFALHQRALELFRLISQIQPDIICLQEGTSVAQRNNRQALSAENLGRGLNVLFLSRHF